MPSSLKISWELLRKHHRRHLSSQGTWLLLGILGPLIITCGMLVSPFVIRSGFQVVKNSALLLAAWQLVFTGVYIVYQWLGTHASTDQDQLAILPLPAIQFYLHRVADLLLLPLYCCGLTLPLFAIVLAYTGVPYGHAIADTYWSWDGSVPNPWIWRLAFTAANVIAATLLPVTLGVVLREIVSWRPLRIVLLPLIAAGSYFLIGGIEAQYFRMCYRQTRGYSPWPFIAVLLGLIFLPILLGWLKRRGRLVLSAAAAALILGLGLLALIGQHAELGVLEGAVRQALGDGRYAMGYFIGHLSPEKNIRLLLHSYPSNVLLVAGSIGDPMPLRLPLWFGAGVYPLLLPLVSIAGIGLGVLLKKTHASEE